MKITLSKSQWEQIGTKTGWIKQTAKIDWNKVDWKKSNEEITQELDTTVSLVSVMRRKLAPTTVQNLKSK
jgi:hypothetical protein